MSVASRLGNDIASKECFRKNSQHSSMRLYLLNWHTQKVKPELYLSFRCINFAIFCWSFFYLVWILERSIKANLAKTFLGYSWFITKWFVPICMTVSATIHPHLPINVVSIFNQFCSFFGGRVLSWQGIVYLFICCIDKL